MTEEEILFAELLDEVIRNEQAITANVKRDIRTLQLDYADIIDKYTRADGTINNSRVGSMMRDIDSLTVQYSNKLYDGAVDGIDTTTTVVVAFLMANIFGAGDGSAMDAVSDIAQRRWNGGLTLRDRVDRVSGDVTDKIRTIVRNDVYRNVAPTDILRDVRTVFEQEDWKTDRIMVSEINNAYRLQFGDSMEKNGRDFVQFYESQWCTHKDHHLHRCHILANEDRYGRGDGVFRTTDMEIYFPHPQCRGFLGAYGGA